MIQNSSLVLLAGTTLLTFVAPFILVIIWVRKTKTKLKPFFVGAGIFIIFALILESIAHSFVLGTDNFISNNTFTYVLYGCIAAGLFEETGRYVAFKYMLKDNDSKATSVTYGLGHGGIEMILLVSLSLLSSFIFATSINKLGFDEMIKGMSDENMIETVRQMIVSLNAYGIKEVLLTIIERTSAMILHVSCSVLVFKTVRNKNWKYILMAFGFHFFMNLPAALAQKHVLTNMWIVELLVFVIALASGYIGYKEYKEM